MVAAALCLVFTPALASSPPVPADFAYGMKLTVSGNEALNELALPQETHRQALRPDLADICVFNGAGEPVPFVLIPTAAKQAPLESRSLPLFTMPAKATGTAAGMALQIRTDAAGAIVSLATRPGESAERGPVAYILDATRLDRPVAGLELSWTAPAENYLGTVQIAVSGDLEHWTSHATGAVASLRTGGETLERRIVEFPPVKAKYYRLTLAPERNVPRLGGASARLAPASAEPARRWLTVAALPVKERNGEYYADMAGHFPIDRLRLQFPEENSIARVTFSSRPDDKAPWAVRQRGLLYRLSQGGTVVESPAVMLPATSDRYWRIQVEESGGGLGGGIPQLEIGWLPDRLVFVARGPAPFLLAYGSAREGLCAARDDTLLTTLEGYERNKVLPAPATAAPQEELTGKAALRPRIPATTWKKALLWGVLTLGVALLGWMASRLYREMETTGGKE